MFCCWKSPHEKIFKKLDQLRSDNVTDFDRAVADFNKETKEINKDLLRFGLSF